MDSSIAKFNKSFFKYFRYRVFLRSPSWCPLKLDPIGFKELVERIWGISAPSIRLKEFYFIFKDIFGFQFMGLKTSKSQWFMGDCKIVTLSWWGIKKRNDISSPSKRIWEGAYDIRMYARYHLVWLGKMLSKRQMYNLCLSICWTLSHSARRSNVPFSFHHINSQRVHMTWTSVPNVSWYSISWNLRARSELHFP